MLQLIQSNFKHNINKNQFAIGLLIAMYTAGTIIIGGDLIHNFVLLTPFNLTVSAGLLIWTHQNWSRKMTFITVLSFLVGFFAEMIGTNTGLIFGNYIYGETLGFQIGHVPLIIGVNWFMLIYASAAVVNQFFEKWHWFIKAISSALLMVGLDIFIEPVAMNYDFWNWENGIIPIQNFVGWFFIALFLLCITHYITLIKNKTAIALFIAQLLFFIILNIFL